jgi:hypothetical protein
MQLVAGQQSLVWQSSHNTVSSRADRTSTRSVEPMEPPLQNIHPRSRTRTVRPELHYHFQQRHDQTGDHSSIGIIDGRWRSICDVTFLLVHALFMIASQQSSTTEHLMSWGVVLVGRDVGCRRGPFCVPQQMKGLPNCSTVCFQGVSATSLFEPIRVFVNVVRNHQYSILVV